MKIVIKKGKYGWMKMYLSNETKEVALNISEVFSPFGDFKVFLKKVKNNKYPNNFELDEEGIFKKFEIKRAEGNFVNFTVYNWREDFDNKNERAVIFCEKIDKDDFLEIFKKAILDLIEKDFKGFFNFIKNFFIKFPDGEWKELLEINWKEI